MAVGILDKVLDGTRRRCVEVVAANEMISYFMFRLPRAVLPVRYSTVRAVDGGRHIVQLGGDHATQKVAPTNDTGAGMVVKLGYKQSQIQRLPRPKR